MLCLDPSSVTPTGRPQQLSVEWFLDTPRNVARKLIAEFVGIALLLVTVVGSGITGVVLVDGNDAVALLANAAATAGALYVLIVLFGPISGAHFNPAVSLAMRLRGELRNGETAAYVAVQIVAAICGVVLAHAMFELPAIQPGNHIRTGLPQWISEAVATFGLLLTIVLGIRRRGDPGAFADPDLRQDPPPGRLAQAGRRRPTGPRSRRSGDGYRTTSITARRRRGAVRFGRIHSLEAKPEKARSESAGSTRAPIQPVRMPLACVGRRLTAPRHRVQDLGFAFLYNALGIPIAAGLLYPFTGMLLSPLIAALAMSLSSVSAIGNALRLRYRP